MSTDGDEPSGLTHLQQLETLSLTLEAPHADLRALAQLPRLRRLRLSGALSGESLGALRDLPHLADLSPAGAGCPDF